MTTNMRVRKGDLVHVLSGKDRGKQGRVIDARPKEGKVIVENINLVKKHTKPRAIQNTSRMGAAGMTPGGVIASCWTSDEPFRSPGKSRSRSDALRSRTST